MNNEVEFCGFITSFSETPDKSSDVLHRVHIQTEEAIEAKNILITEEQRKKLHSFKREEIRFFCQKKEEVLHLIRFSIVEKPHTCGTIY